MYMKTISRGVRLFITTVCLCLFLLPAGAQEAEQDEDNSFEFSGDNTTVIFAEGRERTVLSGDALVISKSTRISAASIEVFGEDFRFVECSGGVEVIDDENNYRLRADTFFFDRELEILRGQGQAVMEDYTNEIVIKGEFLEYRNLENRSEIQVGVRILGDDITARAEFVRYQRDTEVVEFTGLPFVLWRGDEYRASRIIVDMDDDTVELQGQVLGRIEIEDEEDAGAAEPGTPAVDPSAPAAIDPSAPELGAPEGAPLDTEAAPSPEGEDDFIPAGDAPAADTDAEETAPDDTPVDPESTPAPAEELPIEIPLPPPPSPPPAGTSPLGADEQ